MRTSGGLEIGFYSWSEGAIRSATDAAPGLHRADVTPFALRLVFTSHVPPFCDSALGTAAPEILSIPSNDPEYLLPTAATGN